MDESQDWYYARGDAQTGPVSYEQLRAAILAGECRAADLVWREGMRDWEPAASAVGELFVAPEPSAPGAAHGGAAWSGSQSAATPLQQPLPYEPSPTSYVAPAPYPQPDTPQLPYASPMPYGQVQQSHQGMAIGGFVCSLVALPSVCCTGFLAIPLSITGLILGIVARKGMRRTGNPQGEGLALAAIILGIIGLVITTVVIVFYVVLVALQP